MAIGGQTSHSFHSFLAQQESALPTVRMKPRWESAYVDEKIMRKLRAETDLRWTGEV